MVKLSTGARNALCVTGSLRATLNTGKIKIYDGTVPSGPDAALSSNTLLCTIEAAGSGLTFESTASDGVLTKTAAETWQGTNAATGTATFYRWEMTGDTGGASTTEVRVQGNVGVIGADLNLSSVNLTASATQDIDVFRLQIP